MKELFTPLKGVFTTVISPFREGDKALDLESLAREIDIACKAGVTGFLVPCLASEQPLLSMEERRQMVETTARAAAGRAKLITSITADNTRDRIEMMKRYLDYGIDGVNMQVPCNSDEEFLGTIEAIDRERPPFLLIQDADFAGDGIRDELLVKAFEEFESVVGCKVEVKYSGPKYTRLIKKTGGRMIIASGWGNDQLIELLDRGVHTVMPSGMFELFATVYRLHSSGNREAAKRLFYDMLPIIAFTRQSQELNRWFHKRYLRTIGAFDTELSREEVFLDDVHKSYADELIQRALSIRDNLESYC